MTVYVQCSTHGQPCMYSVSTVFHDNDNIMISVYGMVLKFYTVTHMSPTDNFSWTKISPEPVAFALQKYLVIHRN